ncbi:MAG: hypothetical protein JWO47_1010 [Candidatus Saccharibacteria bacterium]|nr:hypothetical protein [Candidatus Saccharibacteria bacterium]
MDESKGTSYSVPGSVSASHFFTLMRADGDPAVYMLNNRGERFHVTEALSNEMKAGGTWYDPTPTTAADLNSHPLRYEVNTLHNVESINNLPIAANYMLIRGNGGPLDNNTLIGNGNAVYAVDTNGNKFHVTESAFNELTNENGGTPPAVGIIDQSSVDSTPVSGALAVNPAGGVQTTTDQIMDQALASAMNVLGGGSSQPASGATTTATGYGVTYSVPGPTSPDYDSDTYSVPGGPVYDDSYSVPGGPVYDDSYSVPTPSGSYSVPDPNDQTTLPTTTQVAADPSNPDPGSVVYTDGPFAGYTVDQVKAFTDGVNAGGSFSDSGQAAAASASAAPTASAVPDPGSVVYTDGPFAGYTVDQVKAFSDGVNAGGSFISGDSSSGIPAGAPPMPGYTNPQ